SNEGRGYVLRRILRRACRHAKLLGIDRAFLCELCEVVIGENISAYPELGDKKEYILKIIANEESRFDATIDSGLSILSDIMAASEAGGTKTLSGEDVFKLYDTYGFPIDLTREIAEEKGFAVDEDAFATLMKEQRERARAARGNVGGWDESSKSLLSNLEKTEFVGYS
ncbi:MAG: alanine--tRNA ligase, partial [Clostridia bacterium]|nr:alanine--tRNA ligase [Clostridia bacterium]